MMMAIPFFLGACQRTQISIFTHPEDKWRVSKENFENRMQGKEVEHFLAMAGVPDDKLEKVLERFFLQDNRGAVGRSLCHGSR